MATRKPPLKILSISTAVNPTTGLVNVFGLGSNNRVYTWDASVGHWAGCWQVPPPIAASTPTKKPIKTKRKR